MALPSNGAHASPADLVDRLGPVAILDIDDTTNVFFVEYLKWRSIWFPTLADDEDVHDWLINRFIRVTHPQVFQPTPGAREALEVIAERYPRLALSARDDDLHRHTYAQLDHHFPGVYQPEDIILIGHRNGTPLTSKLRALEDRGIEPAFIVEDNYRTAREFAQAGVRSFFIGNEPEHATRHPLLTHFRSYEQAWKTIVEQVTSGYI